MRRFTLLLLVLVTWVMPRLSLAVPQVVDPYQIEVYAHVTDPNHISFGALGNLFVGRNSVGNTPTKIWKISQDGSSVTQFGSTQQIHPQEVIYDSSGVVSGTPGSVIVGSFGPNSLGQVYAIRPDQSEVILYDESVGLISAWEMTFSRTGNLLIADNGNKTVWTTTGGPLTSVISANSFGIAVDQNDQIFVAEPGSLPSGSNNVIRVYSSTGQLINASFAQTRRANSLAFGPGGPIWGTDLYTTDDFDNGKLLRFDSFGNASVLGTGFHGNRQPHLAFGPDGALYVSVNSEDRIYRISQPITVPSLNVANINPSNPTPLDFINLDIDGIFPNDGFTLQLPPAVGIFGNDILVDINADSPTGTPNEVPTAFNVVAPVGMLADGGYNYSVDLFVDGSLESTLQGTFSVVTPVTELLSINVNPAQPTSDDIIIAEIDGTFTSAGFDIQLPLDVSVAGNDIVLDIFASSPSGSPHQALTPFNVGTGYVRLPAGIYDQTVNLFVDGGLEDTITGSFTVGVIPEPGMLVLLTLGGVALLRRQRRSRRVCRWTCSSRSYRRLRY